MKDTLNLWVIEDVSQLPSVLNLLRTRGNSFLYTNSLATFSIGSKSAVRRKYGVGILNEEANILILFDRNSDIDEELVTSSMDSCGLEYSLVDNEEKEDTTLPFVSFDTFSFARDLGELDEILEEYAGDKVCEFFPYMPSCLKVKTPDKKIHFIFRGIIKLKGKIIFLTDSKKLPNFRIGQVLSILEKHHRV